MFMQSLHWLIDWSQHPHMSSQHNQNMTTLTFFTHSNHLQVVRVTSLWASIYIHVGLMFVVNLIVEYWVRWGWLGTQGLRSDTKKDTCYDEIRPYTLNLATMTSSTINRKHDIIKRSKLFIWILYNSCISTPNLELETTVHVTRNC